MLSRFALAPLLASFGLALSFGTAGCTVASEAGESTEAVGHAEDALKIPPLPYCLGQITGTPIYRDSGFTAGQDGPNIATLRVALPACASRTWTSLWVHPTVTTITGHPVSTPGYDVVSLGAGPTLAETVDGLSPTTVYKIHLDLFTIASGQFVQVGSTADYTTVTDGTDSLSRARSAIVLHGLKQYDDQQKGLVGAGGVQRDGTRYGADPGEKWCSEFYAWVTSSRLTTTSSVQTNTTTVQAYFGLVGLGAWHSGSGNVRGGKPGDYMSFWSGEHSTMFLGYEPSTDRVFTLEGNVDDRVVLTDRARGEADGLGEIRSMMLRL